MRLILGMTATWLALVAPCPAADEPATDPAAAAQDFVGLYKIVSGEHDGRPIPDEQLQESTVRITPETITSYNKDQEEIYVAKYTVDPRHDPCLITMTQTGGPEAAEQGEARGLIKREGNRVTLIYVVKGGQQPTEFKTTEGSGQNLFVLERIEE